MDTLEVEIRNKDEVWVKFENFRMGTRESAEDSASRGSENEKSLRFAFWFNGFGTGFGDGCGWSGRLADSPAPGGACWCKVLPCAIAFVFCVQAITGFFLWAYYSPSAQTAWESVYYLQYQVAGGWLLRAMHHYTAHVLLAMLISIVVQSILTRACRPPANWSFGPRWDWDLCAWRPS